MLTKRVSVALGRCAPCSSVQPTGMKTMSFLCRFSITFQCGVWMVRARLGPFAGSRGQAVLGEDAFQLRLAHFPNLFLHQSDGVILEPQVSLVGRQFAFWNIDDCWT